MADPFEPLRGLAATSPPPEPIEGLRVRIGRRVRRRRMVTGALAAVLLGFGTAIVVTRDERPRVVDAVDDTTTTSPDEDQCAGQDVVTGDVDGDGRDDEVFHTWDGEQAAAVVGVCTASGVEATMPGLGQSEGGAFILDIEPDGRGEVFFGATGLSYVAYDVGVLEGEELTPVLVDGHEALNLEEGALQFDESGELVVTAAAYGCEDLAGTSERELVTIDVEYGTDGVTWRKVGYDIDGAVAHAVYTDDGTDPLPSGDRFGYPKTLTRSCAVSRGEAAPEWPTEDVFAAVTLDGDVVVASAATGEPVVTVLPAAPGRNAVEVALAPDRSAVFVATRGDHGGGDLLRIAPGQNPIVIGRGDGVAISPDGLRLAVLGSDPNDLGRVAIVDSTTGSLIADPSIGLLIESGDHQARAVEWLPDGRMLVEAGFTEAGSEIFVVAADWSSVQRLGPPDGAVGGTGWALGGPIDGGSSLVVLETCCARDANSYEAPSSLLTVATSSGAERSRAATTLRYGRISVCPGDVLLVVDSQCCGGPDARLVQLTVDGQTTPLGGPIYEALDW